MTLPTSLSHPCYHDDDTARETFEVIRWPNGQYCPHCGAFDTVAPLGGKSMDRVGTDATNEPPPNWWTPLVSSEGSGKVSNGPRTATIHG
jgi:hypothetical protein